MQRTMAFRKVQMPLALFMLLLQLVHGQDQSGSGQVISLLPRGRCDGKDGRPRSCKSNSDCGDCPDFQCKGCPSCDGSPFQGTCLSRFIVFGCAACPECTPGQECTSDAQCAGCPENSKCNLCPGCGSRPPKGTCGRPGALVACPAIGCIDCDQRPCTSNSDCTGCGRCLKCPDCTGRTPRTGKCSKQRVDFCPVLDCKCDKRGSRCRSTSDCCPGSETCAKCSCRNFNPQFGECIARSFKRPPFGASSFAPSLGSPFPKCPPCLPDFDFPIFPGSG